MYKVLIVEDDNTIAEEVGRHLIKWGYEVEAVTDFGDVLGHFGRFLPQLVLMDIGLPFYNGYYWCGEIRKVSQVPVVFVSSASDNMNIVMAVNMGGDDFITKPFELEVLAAKVQAILRRTYSFSAQTSLMEYKGLLLNLSDMTLVCRNEKIELSKNEYKILQTLFENTGKTVTREIIMKRLWDDECFVDDNTLTVNINRLRKKLEGIGMEELIVTKKGIGYKLGEL
ncbi:response regulator transcription factor [Kineothrix sedimenti]|uniref:Stage 0 sporulation protein A homolog n=1 Tax=Kineothrix sedimenti TaxID=3123317 RepID=A0ABZ3EY64_9FIRM